MRCLAVGTHGERDEDLIVFALLSRKEGRVKKQRGQRAASSLPPLF